ncbi:MAG TPA: pitrilysin family protein, partial [Acidimicrobiales bacterium]|nr:pitrilysin family protein [Acidimicrobiales bacterium]
APVVAVNLWYDVGSRHEDKDRTGFAHLFEHLMFEGSRNVKKGEHFAFIEAAGGTLNATTWCDRTNYFDTAPSNHLELLLWLEADRMGGLLDGISQETLDNQRDVVKNERRQRYDNEPYGTWGERMHWLVYPPGHPYHHPTIGSMEHLDAASLDDVRAFFRRYYAPNNAVLSIVGDVSPDEARTWVERYFGGIARNDDIPPPPDGTLPPRIGAEVREVVPDKVQLEKLFVGYRAPAYGTPEFDALLMGLVVVGMGRGSRLHKRLVLDGQLAKDTSASPWPFVGGAAVATATATARQGVPVADVEVALHEVMESLADGVSDQELARARGVIERYELLQLQAVSDRADAFGEYATLFDNPGLVNTKLDDLLAVTGPDIAKSAADVLVPDNRVVLTYVPEEEGR